jgi:hypothetical protein
VNVPRAGHVAVVNRDSGKVQATWVLNDAASNYAMALDEAGHRLFIATRAPALLLTYDTRSGRRMARTPTCGDADDLFFDQAAKQLYVVCGEGRVDVVKPKGDSYVGRIQPVIATHSLNRSAGVWKPSVLRGLSFNCLAIALS